MTSPGTGLFSLKLWVNGQVTACIRVNSMQHISQIPPRLLSQTVSVIGQGPVLCQGCSHLPHSGLPWHCDTLQRNSVVAPTGAMRYTVCTYHKEFYLRDRELTKSILKRRKRKTTHILLRLGFIWLSNNTPFTVFYCCYVKVQGVQCCTRG